jgi:uncharacterized protein YdeI (YjbR/CyaY-like superfamily)
MALARFPALTRILYLESAAALRRWFEAHHATAAEVWVGFWKKESGEASIVEPYAGMLRKNKAAWKFFAAQPPWYRKTASWWITRAKREETRLKRLATLIQDSSEGRTLRQLTRPPRKNQEPGR